MREGVDLTGEADRAWFPDWLSRAWPGVHRIVFHDQWIQLLPVLGSLGVFSTVVGYIYALFRAPSGVIEWVNITGHLVILLLALFAFLPRLGKGRQTVFAAERDPAKGAAAQFLNWLYALVMMWILFYLTLLIGRLPQVELPASVPAVVNVLSTIPFIGLYVVLAKKSSAEPFWGIGGRLWTVLGVVVLVAALHVVAEVLPRAEGALAGSREFDLLADIANGIVVGASLALLVGRLDSRYIGLSGSVVALLYLYALIQPLYPYVFEAKTRSSDLQLRVQYVFVALALIMKSTLILTAGRLIDSWRLHFYIVNLQWLDAHAATMVNQHDVARHNHGISRPHLPLFVVPRLGAPMAELRLERFDLRVSLSLMNAWLGVEWDVKQFTAERVRVSGCWFKVEEVKAIESTQVRLSEDVRTIPVTLLVRPDVDSQAALRDSLSEDPTIADALQRDHVPRRKVPFELAGLQARVAMIEPGAAQYHWIPLEPISGTEPLVGLCQVDLAAFRSSSG